MSDKQTVLETVSRLPDTATLAEIREELALMESLREGLADSEADRVIDHDEIKRRFS